MSLCLRKLILFVIFCSRICHVHAEPIHRQFISPDDFYQSDIETFDDIIIDIRIVPIDLDGKHLKEFPDEWMEIFTDDRIQINETGNEFIPLRTVVILDPITNSYKTKQYIQQNWVDFKGEKNIFWYQTQNGSEKSFHFDESPFFYIDAQRDIIEDIKLRNSYLGKMLSNIEYSEDNIKTIEKQIQELNYNAVNSSPVLSNIESSLKDLDTAMDTTNNGVNITPFPKKIRDLNKGISIQYSDYSMEYHGMGTRSWSSLLTLKSFITFLYLASQTNEKSFSPIIAIEEPESHLHPNAQKKLYRQMDGMIGQKIITTHSPYIAASLNLSQIRNFYKNSDKITCGSINTEELSPEDQRKILRQVINARGEIFFAKIIVFFEGETEEQALPIFAEKFFGKSFSELGIDFIGVGGYGNYLPFIRVAESLKIQWFIFSDGEESVKKSLIKTLKKLFKKDKINLASESNIVILDDECDFEKYLLVAGYEDEIKEAFAELHSETYLEEEIKKKDGTSKGRIKTAEICDTCKQSIYQDVLRDYRDDKGYKDALYDCMIAQKTQFGPVIAETINKSQKGIPKKINELFVKIKDTLKIKG